MLEEVAARLAAAASTPAPFRERLVWFWSNHFTVSAEKALVFALVGSFEREAIRPHVSGRFADMLLAATRHPAMILYLDNHLSVRKGWQARGLRGVQSTAFPSPTDLNENLAREILELHTLGVNGGYTQARRDRVRARDHGLDGPPDDVRPRCGAARLPCSIPTGTSPGARALLGKTYPQDGIAQGEAVLRDLAAHPATAMHVATKLARHFIADEPPPDAVARIARAFRDSDGHLPTVYAALLDCPEAWQQPARQAEVADRVRGVLPARAAGLRAAQAARRCTPRFAAWASGRSSRRRPKAGRIRPQAWAGGDALWKRIEWAGILAARVGSRVDPLRLAAESYGAALGEPTRRAIERAESRQQGLALWLASPEFQRR